MNENTDELQRQKKDLEEFAAEAHELQDVLGAEGVEHLRAASLEAAGEVEAELAGVDPLRWFHEDLPTLVPTSGDLEFGIACNRAVATASQYVCSLSVDRISELVAGTVLSERDTPQQAATRVVLSAILQQLAPLDLDRRRVAPRPVGHEELQLFKVLLANVPPTGQSPALMILLATVAMSSCHPELVGDDLGAAVESLIRYHTLFEDRRAAARPMDLADWEQLRTLLSRLRPHVEVTFAPATGDAEIEGQNLLASIDNVSALVGAEIELQQQKAKAAAATPA